jgi:hypothetical protein
VEPPGRAGEREFLGDGDEILKMPEFHLPIISQRDNRY